MSKQEDEAKRGNENTIRFSVSGDYNTCNESDILEKSERIKRIVEKDRRVKSIKIHMRGHNLVTSQFERILLGTMAIEDISYDDVNTSTGIVACAVYCECWDIAETVAAGIQKNKER